MLANSSILMLNVFKKAVLYAGPRILGSSGFTQLAARLGRGANLDLSVARDKQLALYSGASLADSRRLLPGMFRVYYTGDDPNRIIPGKDVASVASFVPYYRGFTSVVLFNFFKSNYGIRDPILYRYSIFNGREVVWCRQFVLAADRVINIPDPAATVNSLPEHGNLVIEAFHPRISVPTKELRYFVIYRDLQQGSVAGSHSLGLGREGLPRLAQPSFRGFGDCGSSYFHHSAIASHVPLAVRGNSDSGALGKFLSYSSIVAHGYMTRESPSGCPTTIWHEGVTPHFISAVDSERKAGASYTAFFIPDFKLHVPLVLVSSSQIGYLPKRIMIHLIAEDAQPIARKEVGIETDNATVDFKHVFCGQDIAGSINAIIEFDRDIGEFPSLPEAYVHVYYRSPQGLGDQVHSLSTFGYRDDPFSKYKSYRCRKFAPFLKDKQIEFVYSVINATPGVRASHDDSIKIRIFTDSGSEFVLSRKLSPAGITNIRGTDLFAHLPVEIHSAAVVQLEHETTNFNASWFAIDKPGGHLGVDHFTGG